METKTGESNDLFWSGHKNRKSFIQSSAIKKEISEHTSPLQTIRDSFYMKNFKISGIQHFRKAMNKQESKPSTMQHSFYKDLVLWLETRQTQKVTRSLNVATKAYIPSSSNTCIFYTNCCIINYFTLIFVGTQNKKKIWPKGNLSRCSS